MPTQLAIVTSRALLRTKFRPSRSAGQNAALLALGVSLTDVLGNQVSMMFAGFPPAMVHAQTGKLVAIGMSTKDRLRAAPEVPSVSETPGVENYDFPVWVALFAPAGTPAGVLDRLHRESVSIFATPAIRANIEKAGMTVSDESRATFAAFVKSEYTKYQKIIKEAGIKEE